MVEKCDRFTNCLVIYVVIIAIAFIVFLRQIFFTMVQQDKVMLLTASFIYYFNECFKNPISFYSNITFFNPLGNQCHKN